MNNLSPNQALIPVGNEWAIVDKADYDALSQHRWLKHSKGYAYRSGKDENGVNKMILMHRQIMQPAPGLVVDHINHDPLDNTRANLRTCTQRENMKNRKKVLEKCGQATSSRFKGVYRYQYKTTVKYKATIWCNGKQKHIGYFKTEVAAAKAYDKWARKLHGKFAMPNFP